MSVKCTYWVALATLVAACGASGGDDAVAVTDAGRTDGGEKLIVPEGCDVSADPHSAPACSVDSYVVYVSASAKDNNEGSRAKPVKTIEKALTLTGKNRPRVYVCAGEYAEAVKVTSGIVLAGGFDCGSWEKGGETHVAPSERGEALRISDTDGPASVWDVRFTAKDGVDPGESSVAGVVSKSAPVTFTRVVFEAGKGVDGKKGDDGAAGEAGEKGNDASGVTGGAAKVKMCASGSSTGGAGGVAKVAGGDGLSVPNVTMPAPRDGKGGAGYTAMSGKCESGSAGGDGSARTGGKGAGSFGTIASSWIPSTAENGEAGGPGQGGGGGGGGDSDGSGSGGSGGCGGVGGAGGASGGASVALLVTESNVSLAASKLVSSAAGVGGAGGAGGAGGGGGGGTTGACGGGRAGNGAGGSGGGGGAGGISVGVVSKIADVSLDAESLAAVATGAAGSAGAGGALGPGGSNSLSTAPAGTTGTAGTPGISQSIYEIQ